VEVLSSRSNTTA